MTWYDCFYFVLHFQSKFDYVICTFMLFLESAFPLLLTHRHTDTHTCLDFYGSCFNSRSSKGELTF